MSGFVDRLVARGAALGAVPGVVSLQPRPATRFEGGQDAGAIETELGERIAPPRADALPAAGVSSPQAAIPRARRAGAEMPVRQPRAGRPERMGAPRPPLRADAEIPGVERIAPARIPAGSDEEDGADAANVAWQDGVDELVSPPPAAPVPGAVVEHAAHADIVEAEVQALTPAPLDMPLSPPFEGSEPGEAARLALPLPAEHVEAPPPVTVSVGRIDVQFAQPARAAAAPAPRPRGFASYASARRGNPR